MFYTWLAIVITLSIVEILTVNLVSVWFVASGIIAMIISLITDNITIQIAVFVLLGLILMLLTKKIVKKIVPKKEKTNLNLANRLTTIQRNQKEKTKIQKIQEVQRILKKKNNQRTIM